MPQTIKPQQTQGLSSADQLYRYVFNHLDCRGEFIQLTDSLDQIFKNHQYPQPVKQILAELMTTTALLTATLKFSGDISVQIQGDGPIKYAVVNGNNHLQMRGFAKLQGEIIGNSLVELMGNAHMVITITPDKGERYQGIVLLEGDSIAACVEDYFRQSEQLKTRIWIASDLSEHHNRAAALFLQVLPVNKVKAEEDFEHLAVLSNTVKPTELLDLEAHTLLNRLYHQDELTIYPPQSVSFKCGCSKEKTQIAISSIGKQALLEEIEAKGVIKVDCQFCLTQYAFFAEDIRALKD